MHFTKQSRCILYGTHLGIAQNMLDYDFLCERGPSVAAFLSGTGKGKQHKLFYGDEEIFISTLGSREEIDTLDDAENIDTLINLASFRSCTVVNKGALLYGGFTQVFTIAEGVSERESRELITMAKNSGTTFFGPSIVGGLIAGVMRIGHTGGSLDNILKSRLYKKGSVALVTKSGGMMNELMRIVSKKTDGVHTAFQVGGDRFPMTTFVDVMKYYEKIDGIRLVILLGEVGNRDELIIANMIKMKEIKKPVLARCVGTSAEKMKVAVQFGHAGAKANSDEEKASYKNKALHDAGAFVPKDFDGLGDLLSTVFQNIINK